MDDKTRVIHKRKTNKNKKNNDTDKKTDNKKKKPSKVKKALKVSIILFFLVGLVAGIAALGYAYKVISAAPDINPNQLRPVQTSYVYDKNDNVYTTFHGEEDRTLIEYNDIPEHLINAFVAIEDERYWDHPGIDLRAIFRSIYRNLTGGRIEGASTITQQLLKNSILTPARTMERKLQEQWLALQLERMYTKEEILQMYLNRAFLGHYAHGIEAASEMYFGKSAKEVDLAEAAMLAGITQTPNYYSPYNNLDAAINRRNLVLNKMVELEYITSSEAEEAKSQEVILAGSSKKDPQPHPQYTWHAKEVAKRKLIEAGVVETGGEADNLIFYGGLHIYTAIDLTMQAELENAVLTVLDGVGEEEPNGSMGPQVAAIIIEQSTGEVRAAVGDRDVTKNGLKRYAQSHVSTGSSVKPVIDYAAGIEQNILTAGTVIDDAPISYTEWGGVYRPQNYHRNFLGLVTVRTALVRSLNIPAVKAFLAVGIENNIRFVRQLGINTEVHPYPSSALGATEMTLEEMTRAFGVFGNEGILVGELNENGNWENIYIRKIVDSDGNTLYEANTIQRTAMRPEAAYIMTDILKDVIARFADTRAVSRPAAGKTGTSQGSQYAWFIGYTPDYVGGVWTGHDVYNYSPGAPGVALSSRKWQERNRVDGSQWPARVWAAMMKNALDAAEIPKNDFSKPDNIIGPIQISSKTGLLPGTHTPNEFRINEIFIRGTEPTETDDFFQQVLICSESSLLASEYCPAASQVIRYRFDRDENYDRVDEQGNQLDRPLDYIWEKPSKHCDIHLPGGAYINEDGEIVYPDPPIYVEPDFPGNDTDPEEPVENGDEGDELPPEDIPIIEDPDDGIPIGD